MDKRTTLNNIIIYCQNRFNNGLATDWKHSDFANLSREIMRDTGVNISPNTLKRIFGKISVDDDYLPQQATIDALKKYGRYVPQEISSISLPQVEDTPKRNNPFIFKKYQQVIVISLIIISGLFLYKILTSTDNLSGSIKLARIEGILPQTVFFDLQLPSTKDSIFVNFGDKSPRAYVDATQKSSAHNYLFPGIFQVSLQTKSKTIATTKVYVRSDKWIGLGFHNQRDLPNRHYEFPAIKTGTDSVFHINNSQLYKTGMDTVGRMYIRLCNYTPTNYHADDFVFETTFKNKLHEDGIYCNSTKFQIAGTNSIIRFMFVNQGCSFGVLNNLSEQVFNGSKSNLSQFVIDLRKWNTVKLINHHKHVSLFVNNKLLFEGTYTQPLGEIKGLFLEFAGNGFVKNCDLKTHEGKSLYHF